MQERDLQYTQMEDNVSAIGMAKDIGLSYLNPFYRPGLFKFRQGAISLAPLNSAMGIAKFISNKVDKGQTYSRIRKSIYDSKGYEFLAAMENKSYYAPFKGSWKGNIKTNINDDFINYHTTLVNKDDITTIFPAKNNPPPSEIINQTQFNGWRRRRGRITHLRNFEVIDTFKRISLKNKIANKIQPISKRITDIKSELKKSDTWIKGSSEAGRKIARGATRIGIGALKGLAYYNVLSLAYDVTSWASEPLGRSVINMIDYGTGRIRDIAQPELGGSLPMSYLSHGAATERQRAINAISKAGINGRSNLGREASFI